MVEEWGWQIAAQVLAIIGVVILLIVAFAVRKSRLHLPSCGQQASWKKCFQGPILRYAFMTIGLYAPLAILVDMWGIPFLSLKYAISREQAASITMLGYLGLAAGSALLPIIIRSQKSLHQLILYALIGVSLCMGMIILGSLPMGGLAIVFLALGFLCGSLMLCYPAIGLHTTPNDSGFIFGFANAFLMLGEGALNFVMGALLDFQSGGVMTAEGTHVYTLVQYQSALSWIFFPILGLCIGFAVISKRGVQKIMNQDELFDLEVKSAKRP
jgi:fucose permease